MTFTDAATQQTQQKRMRTGVIIINPQAFHGNDAQVSLKEAQQICLQNGLETRIAVITPDKTLEAIAEEAVAEHPDIIIAAGGDGTAHIVAAKLYGTDIIFAILPLGTMNNLAYSLGMPADLRSAAELLSTAEPSAIDAGTINGLPFFEVVSIGAEASFIPLAENLRHHGAVGAIRAFISGLQLFLRLESYPIKLHFSKRHTKRIRAWQITVCNAPVYGLRFNAAADAKIDDGYLDVIAASYKHRWELIRHYRSIMSGQRELSSLVSHYRVKRMRITSDAAIPIVIDGEQKTATPAHIQIHPKALRVIRGIPPQPQDFVAEAAVNPLASIARSLAPREEHESPELFSHTEAADRAMALLKMYWILFPVYVLAQFGLIFVRRRRQRAGQYAAEETAAAPPPKKEMSRWSRALMSAVLPALFLRLRMPAETFSYALARLSRLPHRLLARFSRNSGNIPAPDAPIMETVAGIGSLMAGMWISRKPSASRNVMLAALAAVGGLFIRMERQNTQDRSLRRKESVALGSILGGVLLGGLLGFIAYFRSKLAIAPQSKKRPVTILPDFPDDAAAVDYAPVAQMMKLERGDIILFGPDNTPIAKFIEIMTRSHYHHVAIYDGGGMVIESMPGGVRRYALGQRNITGIRPNTPVEQRIAAADWARSHIGDEYDTRGLALIALDRILPGLRLENTSAARYSCAVFVADMYLHSGVDLLPEHRWQDLAPGDFIDLMDRAPRRHIH